MSKKSIRIALVILGLFIVEVSLLADTLGIGNRSGIGWKQIAGMVVGVLVAIGGWVWGMKKKDVNTKDE
jgi:hypothetical protein